MGKATYVSVFGMERAQALARSSHERTHELLGRLPGPTDDLRALVDFTFARRH